MNKKTVPVAVVKRLPRYYRYINELVKADVGRVSSKTLSQKMGLTASQIRQDFNCFGGFGQQGYGYSTNTLNAEISSILGVDVGYRVIVVGMGNLGNAIANNINFKKRGVSLIGLFDCDTSKIGNVHQGIEVLDINNLEDFCSRNKPEIAVLTLPKTVTVPMYEKLKELGIKGFWNFSNMELTPSENIRIENVHIADSLMTLCYSIKEMQSEK